MPKALILKQLIPHLAQSVTEFEKEIGAGNGAVGKAWRDDNNLSDGLTRKILKRYSNVNEKWLETGEGEMFVKKDGVAPPKGHLITPAPTDVIPASKYIEMLERHYEDMKATKEDLQYTKNELLQQQSQSIAAISTLTERNSLFESTLGTIKEMLAEMKKLNTNSVERFDVIENIGKTVIANQQRQLEQQNLNPFPLPAKKAAAHRADSK